MSAPTKKPVHRSPNYPIKPLDWAVQTTLGLLEIEGKHAVPPNIIAQNLGYKDSTNGKARRVLANLKAFGLLEKAPGGKLAVSPDVVRYKIMPTDDGKKALLKQWLRKPSVFTKLLEKYDEDLPSDKVLIFELVDEQGFSEQAAESALSVLRASLDFVSLTGSDEQVEYTENNENISEEEFNEDVVVADATIETVQTTQLNTQAPPSGPTPSNANVPYPIRLAGGRMAWIYVPDPFYEADKKKLLAQIEIIGTADDDNDFGEMDM